MSTQPPYEPPRDVAPPGYESTSTVTQPPQTVTVVPPKTGAEPDAVTRAVKQHSIASGSTTATYGR